MTQCAVTLDLWNTLIGEDAASKNARLRSEARVTRTMEALREAGEAAPRQALEEAFAGVRRSSAADQARGHDMTFDERVRQLLSLADPGLPERVGPGTLSRLRDALDTPFLAHPPRLFPGVAETLEALAGLGVTLAIISNTGLTSPDGYARFLEGHGVRRFFTVLSFSTGRGIAKPSNAMFRDTLAALRLPPSAALHVGDDLRADVAGAHRAGLRTVWVSGVDPSEPEIPPDFTVTEIAELPAVVRRWLDEPPPPVR